jgi:hypothetical protein
MVINLHKIKIKKCSKLIIMVSIFVKIEAFNRITG